MTRVMSSSPPTVAKEYSRRARRIRAIYRGDTLRTQRALAGLVAASVPTNPITRSIEIAAANREAAAFSPGGNIPRLDWSDSAILGHRAPQARAFADRVAASLVAGILPQTMRQKLIRRAMHQNISRFEANLIIAAVQHRLGTGLVAESPIVPPVIQSKASPHSFGPRLACFAAAEIIIAVSIWLLVR